VSTTSSNRRTIVVTGAGSGIGRACALRLAGTGSRVVALDRNAEAARSTAAEVDIAGGLGIAAACDVTDRDGVEASLAGLARIDVLINSAGVFGERALMDITADDLRNMYEVNVVGLFTVTQAAIQRMPDGGRIVNIGSRAYLGSRDHAHYVASKAAVIGLTRTVALELGERQILVNSVAPGMVRTPLLSGISEERLAQMGASYPGGRLPEPEDVAQAVAFFADPATCFITGQVLILDGGRSVGLSGA